jgi:hypothetical protein
MQQIMLVDLQGHDQIDAIFARLNKIVEDGTSVVFSFPPRDYAIASTAKSASATEKTRRDGLSINALIIKTAGTARKMKQDVIDEFE